MSRHLASFLHPRGVDAIASRSHLVAIVYADAVGSSAAMHGDELGTIAAVDEALESFSADAREFGGQILSYTGDGAIALFDSAVAGVAFAVSYQASNEGRAVPFRVGVHLGETFERNGRTYGDSLNLAARVQSVAEPAAVYVSEAVYQAVRGSRDFSFQNLGPRQLKGFDDPVNVYRVFDGTVAATLKPSSRVDLAGASSGIRNPTIAVLPFLDRSDAGDQSYFADGVADDIITNLCHFQGLDVIARGSSFAFKSLSLSTAEAGKLLGARYLVEGSVRRQSGRVRVTVELSEVASGKLIWAERYDRSDDSIFDIQDEIASNAVGAISMTVDHVERVRAATLPPDSLEAYGLVLQGTSHMLSYEPAGNHLAREMFERALDLSPSYSRAAAVLSRSHNLDWRYSWSSNRDASLDRALALAAKAIENNASDFRGYAELGYVRLYMKEHDRSLACYERAHSLNPFDANTIAEHGDALAHAGLAQDALPLFDRAMRLNPFYPDQYLWYKAGALTKLHRFQEAIDCIQHMNNPAQGRRILACCYAHLGMLDEARREGEIIKAEQPGFDARHWTRNVVPDRRLEDVELFETGLRVAGL